MMKPSNDRIRRCFAFACAITGTVFIITPAFASVVKIPEPSTLSVFAAGIVAAYLIRRRNRRK